MTEGIPVMIHLPAATFKALEAAADRQAVTMRELIVSGLVRATQPRPTRTSGQVPSTTKGSAAGHYRRLDADEWAELKRLRTLKWTVPELAVKYGCSSSAIYYRLRREQTMANAAR